MLAAVEMLSHSAWVHVLSMHSGILLWLKMFFFPLARLTLLPKLFFIFLFAVTKLIFNTKVAITQRIVYLETKFKMYLSQHKILHLALLRNSIELFYKKVFYVAKQ